ncbi:hypothetical protein AVEN_262316-1, partial [Araneus ventricosus]
RPSSGFAASTHFALHCPCHLAVSRLSATTFPYTKDGRILGIPNSWHKWLSHFIKAGIISLPSTNNPIFLGAKENAVAIKFHTTKGQFSLLSAYSSPYSEIQRTLQDIRNFISNLGQESLLLGADMNAHSTRWGYFNDNPEEELWKILSPAPI